MIQESDKLIADALNKGEDYWTFRGDAAKDSVHSMFAYPAMMVPKMQREILETIDEYTRTDAPFAVLDPFMGSGTILVEGMLRGYEKIKDSARLEPSEQTASSAVKAAKRKSDNSFLPFSSPDCPLTL